MEFKRKNPYVNYSDNSVPNIQDISKYSRNQILELGGESEMRNQESSSAIYDQEPFENDASATFMVEEILNQHS